jgi:hypothetical protein
MGRTERTGEGEEAEVEAETHPGQHGKDGDKGGKGGH